jgi:hypothetical protein
VSLAGLLKPTLITPPTGAILAWGKWICRLSATALVRGKSVVVWARIKDGQKWLPNVLPWSR